MLRDTGALFGVQIATAGTRFDMSTMCQRIHSNEPGTKRLRALYVS